MTPCMSHPDSAHPSGMDRPRDVRTPRKQRFPQIARSETRRGFTLVDLTITVLIMGVVAATASPRFAALLTSYTAEAAARRVAADLNYAASAAAQTSQSVTVTFNVSGDSYSVVGVDSPDHPGSAWAVSLTNGGYNVDLVSVDFAATQTVTFNAYGRPNNPGSIILSSGSDSATIVVDAATGRATVQ
jgi:type IV fimbrial biogenesis protein FimT